MLALKSIHVLQEKAFEENESCFNLNFALSSALSTDEVHLRNNKNRYELHRPHAGPLLHQIVTKLSTGWLLGFLFARYVPLASRNPYPISLFCGHIIDHVLVTLGKK